MRQGLLGGEAENDRRERAADGQGLGLDSGDPQRGKDDDDDRAEPDQEADGAGSAGLEPAEEGRLEALGGRAREQPAEQGDDRLRST